MAGLETPKELAMEDRDEGFNPQNQKRSPRPILCIYTQQDEPFYRKLQTHLSLWQREGHIQWLETLAGSVVEQTMHVDLQLAELVLLLISPDFFAEDRCYMAMKAALQEQGKRSVPVVPILARASAWKKSACGGLQALPDTEQPIAEWNHPEQAYENIRAGLARFIPGLPVQSITRKDHSRIFQARDLPRGYIPRPKAFETIKRTLLNHQGNQTTAITTALRGAGGFGKTTLALALCHDPEIQDAFPDGILWIELGEHPPRSLDVMNGVLASLGPSRSLAITLEEARDRWRKALASRRYLLVIDDVWQAPALSPLLEGGPNCMRLITTRNDWVLPEEAIRLFVDAMEPAEAIAVLCRNLPVEIHHASFQPTLSALAERLGYWPLLLTLANSMLVAQVRHGRALLAALAIIEQAYETRGVLAFDPGNLTDRERAVKACIEVSLRHLEEFTSPHYQAVERYQELAIFPEDTDIPLETLRRYWQGTGGLAAWEADDLCMHLHDLSLLLTCNLATNTIRLHDVMRSYLIQRTGSNLSAQHARFLDVSKEILGFSRWADLPAYEHYLWHYLVQHLCKAVRAEELEATLTNLLYLARKALYTGIPALETDLLRASTFEFEQAEITASVPSLFASLYRMVVRVSHLLWQVSTLAEVGGLLLSYLGWEPPITIQRSVFWHELPRPFLSAWHPLPSGSSSALRRTLRGHTNTVFGCAISPDGSFIVSSSHDQTLKVWDTATNAERLTLTGHTSRVNGCAISPDGNSIVSASNDQTLKVWDATTGAERLTLIGHTKGVVGCAVSPDGSFIVSSSWDHTLKVWDTTTGVERFTLIGHTKEARGCAVSPDGSFIVSASDDNTLKVWDTTTGIERHTLTGHISEIFGCAVSPDGSFVVSASNDNTLKVWDTTTGIERHTLIGHTSYVNGCTISPDSRFIVSASDDNTLKVWDTTTGIERHTLTGHTNAVTGCTVSPDGSFIVSSSWDHTLKVWDTTTRAEHLTLIGHTSWVGGCAVSPDGSFIVSSSWDHTLKVWDTTTGGERLILVGHTDWVESCAVSPDGSFIVSASRDHTLKVWDTITGVERLTLTGHTEGVNGCAVSPDGNFIVSSSSDQTLKVWDAATGSERLTLTGHTEGVNGCAVSPDGNFIISSSSDQTLKVWDAATGSERLTLTGHTSQVFDCVVSPDGSFIVSASNDNTLKVWNTTTGIECFTLTGHTSYVNGCTISPQGL
jgi:WD40 repeat protein